MTPEEAVKVELYYAALLALGLEYQHWSSNFRTYQRWDNPWRLYWIKKMESEAKAGLPMAVELLTKVTELRMAS